MNKNLMLGVATSAALLTSTASGQQYVANTNQLGSLLIWPKITVDHSNPSNPQDTVVEITNSVWGPAVRIACTYVNERGGRASFYFTLAGEQTASWDVWTHNGNVPNLPPFPANGGSSGNVQRGVLVCFAVDAGGANQIAWNHLTGTAQVLNLYNTAATQFRQAFEYNAWSFAARSPTGLAADGTIQGTPGKLVLSGTNAAGSYDSCPAYNTVNFKPNGARMGNLMTLGNALSVVTCNQDLRANYQQSTTQLLFLVWSSIPNGPPSNIHTSAACINGVATVGLSGSPIPNSPAVSPGNVFDETTLLTPYANYQFTSQAALACPGSTPTGLLGVHWSTVAVAGDVGVDAVVGSTPQGTSGGAAGFVQWK